MLAHSSVSNDAAPDASTAALLALTADAYDALESIIESKGISATLVMPISSSCLASPRDIDSLQ